MPASMPASAPPAGGDALAADAAQRQRLEAELARLGMSADEVRRLLAADANSTAPRTPDAPRPAATGSVAALAASLTSASAHARIEAVRQVDLGLPTFRDAAPQEARQAEQLLREASTLRRREKYREAEAKCREALALTPKDAAALELLGDLLQGVARIDEALAAYQRALEADAKRSSAERKYADLLMRQQQWGGVDSEAVEKNPFAAVLLSALIPGAGQVHNGDYGKAGFFFLADLILGYLLGWSPWGFSGEHRHHGINTTLLLLMVVAGVLYVLGLIDANASARAGGKGRVRGMGWDL